MLGISQAFMDALLVGGLAAKLAGGPGVAYIFLYDGTKPPTPGGAPDGSCHLLATIALAAVPTHWNSTAHKLELVQGDLTGDLVAVQGSATWGRLFTADDTWMADGTAVNVADAGDFKVSGTTGTLLYLGARAQLGLTTFG
ncbi:hypothetical protein BH11PSE13_BH11PSE13_12090 [soil metagenome]